MTTTAINQALTAVSADPSNRNLCWLVGALRRYSNDIDAQWATPWARRFTKLVWAVTETNTLNDLWIAADYVVTETTEANQDDREEARAQMAEWATELAASRWSNMV